VRSSLATSEDGRVIGRRVFLLCLAAGCAAPRGDGSRERTAEGHQEHPAPHGGVLVELGDEFAHLELVRDAAQGTLTVYVLDGEAEQPIRLKHTALRLRLVEPPQLAGAIFDASAEASVLTGETVGDSSQFVLKHEAFRTPTRVAGVVLDVEVRGSQFREAAFVLPGSTDGPKP
jgi:hypothetical protein